MLKSYLKNKTTQLFLVLWLHISLLNLFFVNHRGFVFLWQENGELNTLITHFSTALAATLFYLAVKKIRSGLVEKRLTISNNLFAVGSVIMVGLIGLVLL